MRYCTSIGIDTHSKRNQICALARETGEVFTAKLSADPEELITWMRAQDFAQPLRCCYEAGPTDYSLDKAPTIGTLPKKAVLMMKSG